MSTGQRAITIVNPDYIRVCLCLSHSTHIYTYVGVVTTRMYPNHYICVMCVAGRLHRSLVSLQIAQTVSLTHKPHHHLIVQLVHSIITIGHSVLSIILYLFCLFSMFHKHNDDDLNLI